MKRRIAAFLTLICAAVTSYGTTFVSASGLQHEIPEFTEKYVQVDDGSEQTRDGYIYYEDFSSRTKVPDYLNQTVKGLSRVEIEDGALRTTVIYGGNNDHAFLTYTFDEFLSGQIAVETKVKTDSKAFANLLFFFCETNDLYDTGSVVTNVAAEGGRFKNNSGSGWQPCGINCETGVWHDVKMVMDTDKGLYQLTVDGFTKTGISFRKKVTSNETAIKYLRFGSQTAWADLSYKYIGVRTATEQDFVTQSGINCTLDFGGTTKPNDVDYSATGGGSADFSQDGYVTLKTPTSGTVSVSKTFNSALDGVFTAEVKVQNRSSAANTFANVLFLENSAYSGTAANIVTVAIESGRLRYHVNGKWTPITLENDNFYFVDYEWYVIKAIVDCDAKKVKLYVSGEHYKTASNGENKTLGNDIYLGEYAFRNSNIGNPDKIECAIGTGKSPTEFTVDYLKVYSA